MANRKYIVRLVALRIFLVELCLLLINRSSWAEDRFDVKTMDYSEDDERIDVFAFSFLWEKALSESLTLKIDGVYNTISGASPTGAPPEPVYIERTFTVEEEVTIESRNDDDDSDDSFDDRSDDTSDERYFEDRVIGAQTLSAASFHGKAAASSQSSQTRIKSSVVTELIDTGLVTIPSANVDETRVGTNIELIKAIDHHTVSGQLSFSTESDYVSTAIALKDSLDLNDKNTTLNVGLAYTHDAIDLFYTSGTEARNTIDVIVGVTQLLNKNALVEANLTFGTLDGYLNDAYKVAELNGVLVPENRPDNKTKNILYLSYTQFMELLNASLETSFRYYSDSVGLDSQTFEVAWFQKIGELLVIRPNARFYSQSETEFYDIRFSGAPRYYSSDYRLSQFDATSYGLQFVVNFTPQFSMDASYEIYSQSGKDGKTHPDMYIDSQMISIGGKWRH